METNDRKSRLIWQCSSNGDTLGELLKRREAVRVRRKAADEALSEAMLKVKPIQDEADAAWMELQNVNCRINEWWRHLKLAEETHKP